MDLFWKQVFSYIKKLSKYQHFSLFWDIIIIKAKQDSNHGHLVVVDSLVLHPAAVAGEDGPALPAADVRLDPGVRVEVSFHVGLKNDDVKPLMGRVLLKPMEWCALKTSQ